MLLISTELDEIMQLSDRIAVIFEGRIVGVLDSATATRERVGLMMAGHRGDGPDRAVMTNPAATTEAPSRVLQALRIVAQLSGAVIAALLCGAVLIAIAGADPVVGYLALFDGAFGSLNSVVEVLGQGHTPVARRVRVSPWRSGRVSGISAPKVRSSWARSPRCGLASTRMAGRPISPCPR